MECGSGRQRREHVVRKSGLLACRVRACALAAHGHRYIVLSRSNRSVRGCVACVYRVTSRPASLVTCEVEVSWLSKHLQKTLKTPHVNGSCELSLL